MTGTALQRELANGEEFRQTNPAEGVAEIVVTSLNLEHEHESTRDSQRHSIREGALAQGV